VTVAAATIGRCRGPSEILERAIQGATEQAAKTNVIVDQAMAAGLDGSDTVTIHVKTLRAELLSVKSRSRARARAGRV